MPDTSIMVCKGADSIRALNTLQLKPQYKYASNLYVETWQLCCVASPFCTAGYAGKKLAILQTGPSTTVSVLLMPHEKWAWKKEGRQRMTHYSLKWMKEERVAGGQESDNMIQKDAQRNRERLRAAVTALLSVPWWLCSGWRLTRCIMQHHPTQSQCSCCTRAHSHTTVIHGERPRSIGKRKMPPALWLVCI